MADAIFVINLPHRTDRRRDTERELQRIGWRAEFFPAIRPQDAGGFPSVGARGCFLSHLEVIRRAADASVDRLFILEDDVQFAHDFSDIWPSINEEIRSRQWSFFYPAHFLAASGGGLVELSPSEGVRRTHFVVISGSALRTIADGLETILHRPPGHPDGGPMHVDGAYSTLRRQNPSLTTIAHFPSLAAQRPSATDISERPWFDRISALAPLVAAARTLKHRVVR